MENANTNTEVLKNMGFAAKAMKNAHQNMYEFVFFKLLMIKEHIHICLKLIQLTVKVHTQLVLEGSLNSLVGFRDIDKVDELMQDITEQQELAQEISDAISKPVGFGEEFDEVPGFL